MKTTPTGLLNTVRQEEYTGSNRCLPCTITNIAIAVVLSVALVLVGYRTGRVAMVGIGAGVLVLSLAVIYLRGYLVPGTPELAERYFPARVLHAFGKDSNSGGDDYSRVEEFLIEAEAVTESWLGGDLAVTESFGSAWGDRIRELRQDDRARTAFASTIDAAPDQLRFEVFGSKFVALRNNREVDSWPSEAAFVADVAAVELLEGRHDEYSKLGEASETAVLARLRELRDSCPGCDGSLTAEREQTVASCCHSADVYEVVCDDCGARIYEDGQ